MDCPPATRIRILLQRRYVSSQDKTDQAQMTTVRKSEMAFSKPDARRRKQRDEEVTVFGRADHVRAQQVETGLPVAELCRKLGISEQTFYISKKRCVGWSASASVPAELVGR